MKRRVVTEEMKRQMKNLEEAGHSRKEIALILDVDAATVTRHLGAVRCYRGARIPQAA